MRANEQAFRDRGAALAAVGLGDREYARAFREDAGITFPLLVDERREAYEALELKTANIFHVFRKDNSEARERAKAASYSQQKMGKSPFQLGGSFVFGPGDVDRFAHLSETFSDKAPIASLLAALS